MIHVGRFSGSMTYFLSFSVKIGHAITNCKVQRVVKAWSKRLIMKPGKICSFSEGTHETRFCLQIVLYTDSRFAARSLQELKAFVADF
jgi:hypothetical protein